MIRRTGLVLLLLIGSLACAKAQVGEYRSVLSVGVNGGVALSSVDFDPTIKQGTHVGPTMGLAVRYTCEKYFTTVCALQVELNVTQMGWKETVLSSDGEELEDEYSRDLWYVQLPLLARLGWGHEERGLMFYVLLGPQVGYYVSGKERMGSVWTLDSDGNPDRPNNVYQQYGKEPERKIDYGLTGGLGLELSTGIGHFGLEGRYYYGLGDMYGNSKKDAFGRSANSSIMVKLTYLIDVMNRNKR